jgi:hypothetical protein
VALSIGTPLGPEGFAPNAFPWGLLVSVGQGTSRARRLLLSGEARSHENMPCHNHLAHGGHRRAIGVEPDVGAGRVLIGMEQGTLRTADSVVEGFNAERTAPCTVKTCSPHQGCDKSEHGRATTIP